MSVCYTRQQGSMSTHSEYAAFVVRTTFIRFGRGLNLFGMLSQVFRPIMTAFIFPSGAAEVTFAKYFISLGSLHGRRPAWPIPLDLVAATIMMHMSVSSQEQ